MPGTVWTACACTATGRSTDSANDANEIAGRRTRCGTDTSGNSAANDDDRRAIAETAGNRADFGLPQDGVVFCAFHQSYKIGSREFDIWMRLLERVPGSVLWLLRPNEWIEPNLRREAELRGSADIDAVRAIGNQTGLVRR